MLNERNGTDMGFCFLAGAALGAGVALLFAPQPGVETRDLISRKMREGTNAARRTIEEGRRAATSAVERIEQLTGVVADAPQERA